MDSGTLDTGQDAQIGGEPGRICQREKGKSEFAASTGLGSRHFSWIVTVHGVLSMSIFSTPDTAGAVAHHSCTTTSLQTTHTSAPLCSPLHLFPHLSCPPFCSFITNSQGTGVCPRINSTQRPLVPQAFDRTRPPRTRARQQAGVFTVLSKETGLAQGCRGRGARQQCCLGPGPCWHRVTELLPSHRGTYCVPGTQHTPEEGLNGSQNQTR